MKKNEKGKLMRAEQRKMMLEQRRKKTKTIITASFVIIALISIGVFISLSMNGNEPIQDHDDVEESPIQSQTEVVIPLSGLSDTAKYYTYDSEDVTIRHFAVIGSDGEAHVAFDACDVCYGTKKGYRQIGDVMHCINCGNEYPINSLGTENIAGGCWPSYLPIKIDGDNIIIQISDLEEKKYMF